LRWPLEEAADPVASSPHGVYSFEGSLPYAFTAKAEVVGPAIPRTSFEAGGSLDREGLALERLEGFALRGRVLGRGRLQWTGDQPWRFEIDARSLALGELRRGVDGRLNVRGTIAGNGLSAAAPWTAQLTSLSGTMFGRPLTGRGEIAHRDGVFELRRVRVANGASFADVEGTVGARAMDLVWNVDLRSLAIVADGMKGQLVSRGTARGTPQRPQVTGNANVRQFGFGGITVGLASAEVDLDSSDRRRSRVTVDAETVVVAGFAFDNMRAGLDGLIGDHAFSFVFSSPGDEARKLLEFRGGLGAQGAFDLQQRSWQGNLTQADVVFPDGEARLIQPAALTLGADLQRAAPLCLRTDDDARLCVEGEYQPAAASWRFIYSAQDWPLKRILRTLLGWREFDGRLQASGWAEQAPGKPWVGGSTVLLHEPTFDMPRNKFRTERIHLGSSRLDLFAEPAAIRANLDLPVDESTQVTGEALVDRRAALLSSPLRGRVVGKSAAITVLPLLVPEIDRAAGSLDGEVALAGTLGEPRFNGSFRLRDGRLELYRTNLILSNLQAAGAFDGDELRFDASGQTARGKLTIDGNFGWPQGVMTGSMRLRGDELLVADTPELRIFASPDIVLHAGTAGYDVQGEVRIPTARISPRELTSSVGTSPDERIVGVPDIDEGGPSTADRIRSRIKVALGEAVRVDAYGLKARLEGDVTVSTIPDDVARGNGTISVVEGQYKAFGQDVRITKGLLRYANSPLNEPQLEIVAEREIKDSDITVAVNVRGTLDNPYIAITSTPSMSSNEALSYLLTGRSIDTLQSGEAASVNQAAESLAVSGGGLLLGGLGTRLGLDEVSVERNGEEGDTQVVLGKALSQKLFVSYGISIAEAINTIKLRYTLNDRWSVKAESGLEQSADFEYRIER
jgi:translocation and assembly module TamB